MPLLIIFTSVYQFLRGRRRELIKRGRQPINGTIWGNGFPSLSSGVYAASPPAGGGGWDHFLSNAKRSGLSPLSIPSSLQLLLGRGGRIG